MFPGVELRFISLTVFMLFNLFSVADLKKQSIETKVLNKPDHCHTKAEYGDTVFIHYSAWLESGEMVDSSMNKGPMMLELGGNKIIKGLDMGIRGMCVGEKLSLVIPPEYAYGERGYPPYIPSDATLTFHVELVSIKSAAAEEAVFRMLRFLVAPVAAICIVMYLYKKYQKFPTKKELKGFKKNKKKN